MFKEYLLEVMRLFGVLFPEHPEKAFVIFLLILIIGLVFLTRDNSNGYNRKYHFKK